VQSIRFEDIVVHGVRNGNTHVPVLLIAWLAAGGSSAPALAELAPPDYAEYHAGRSYAEGLLALRAGDTEAALASAEAALALVPDDPDALYLEGICLLFAGQWADAETSLQRVVALRPDLAEAYHDLGMVQLRRGDDPGATASFARLSDLRPGSWHGPYREAQTAALLRNDWVACEERLTEALRRGFPWLASLPVDPEWESVAGDPAFLEMLEKMLRDGGRGGEMEERGSTVIPRPRPTR